MKLEKVTDFPANSRPVLMFEFDDYGNVKSYMIVRFYLVINLDTKERDRIQIKKVKYGETVGYLRFVDGKLRGDMPMHRWTELPTISPN